MSKPGGADSHQPKGEGVVGRVCRGPLPYGVWRRQLVECLGPLGARRPRAVGRRVEAGVQSGEEEERVERGTYACGAAWQQVRSATSRVTLALSLSQSLGQFVSFSDRRIHAYNREELAYVRFKRRRFAQVVKQVRTCLCMFTTPLSICSGLWSRKDCADVTG